MNNEQFRRLLGANTPKPAGTPSTTSATPKPTALGSRLKSSIPMTPRSVRGGPGVDFARQLAERDGTAADKPANRFRSAAPKGSRLASGYTDRTRERVDLEGDEKAGRIKALEEGFKKGEMTEEEFVASREAIAGGDVGSTYLVKGLDWKLLERAKRGEDVWREEEEKEEKEEEPAKEEELDDEFEQLEKAEVVAVAREEKAKKGDMAPPPLGDVAGVKRTRNQILADLKAQRQRDREAKVAALQLNDKFRKITDKKESVTMERDARGREVMVITDAEGNVKRKVRKNRPEPELPQVDPEAKPLDADVVMPEPVKPPPPDSDEDDIFGGVGTEYDPLAGLEEDDSASSDEGETDDKAPQLALNEDHPLPAKNTSQSPSLARDATGSPSPASEQDDIKPDIEAKPVPLPRNYFNDDPSTLSVLANAVNPLKDADLLAALSQSRKIDASKFTDNSASTSEESRLKRKAAILSGQDRDLEDMDLGFGSSRFDDAEEMATEGGKFKLAKWKGLGAEDEDEEEGREKGAKKRKRGPKKRKGDKNSVADVLKVIEGRK
ncbi:hypothetical protein EJ06DRAFT_528341 [Trichodelitschia bisporula]|uniref:RED-like N-terminal domain-containing protein n=1 Tax=Trichodelitschia bisporula TaxID=703511 RepID=A0A6G1I1U1_9PEZI|nr:hypothetical protein EJ06DRAFT_528341 [Trichodelitschia bisporula]